MEIVEFIKAQLDEDERVAKKAGEAMGFDDPCFPDYRTYDGWELKAADAFILHLSPARVLREVESKRRLLGEYDLAMAERRAHPKDLANVGWWLGTLRMLKLLALPYADREGFREEWRP